MTIYRSGKVEERQRIGSNETTNLGVRSSNLFGRANYLSGLERLI